uniref:Protein kinase domain-containing protein n=1 Tax=Alexandrium monilatum TaxID=311494 RepID=A0A7S4PYU1_9DINO
MAPLKKEDLTIGEEIGKGRFKSVVRGTLRRGEGGPQDVVVLNYVKSGERRELEVLSMIARHPLSSSFVPEIYGAINEGRSMLVVQERALGGSLKAAVGDARVSAILTPRHRLFASAGLARAMVFLESCHIVHADLSCRNVLLCSFNAHEAAGTVVKVTDFGLAVVLKEGADSEVRKQPQATRWCAPETVAHSKFSHRSDVWAMGMTLWELFSNGEFPWARWQKRNNVGARLRALLDMVAKGAVEDLAEDFPAPSGCSPTTHAAILSCLRVDELTRPGFAQLAEEYEEIAMDPKEFPELSCEEESDLPQGADADVEAEAPCDTSVTPSEVEPCSDACDEAHEAQKVVRPDGTGTPSTSATPTVPWWQTRHLDTPSDLFTGPKADAFAEALRDFLHSERVKDVLGDKAGLEALKEFLCSPHALELLSSEAKEEPFVDYLRHRAPKVEQREPVLPCEARFISRARRCSAPPQCTMPARERRLHRRSTPSHRWNTAVSGQCCHW